MMEVFVHLQHNQKAETAMNSLAALLNQCLHMELGELMVVVLLIVGAVSSIDIGQFTTSQILMAQVVVLQLNLRVLHVIHILVALSQRVEVHIVGPLLKIIWVVEQTLVMGTYIYVLVMIQDAL